jgi:branched-chain amino acid transport system substrate-binding protein
MTIATHRTSTSATRGPAARHKAGIAACAALGLALGTSLSACGGSSGSSSSTADLVIADLAPFTGADAALGPIYLASCYGATHAINAAGGVLGHHLTCKSVDTRGDPADAVPATRQMFASTGNLALVIGVTSDEASAVVPIINANKTVVFSMTGQSEFDNTKFDYFYRLVAPDLAESYAMVAIAQQKHYQRIALAFGNDIGSQTFVGPAVSAVAKAGMQLVSNQTLDLHATTFRTEADKVVAAHPDVILTEALGPAEASFLSEVKSLNGGAMIPVIGTSATIDPSWYQSVSVALGPPTLAASFLADNIVVDTSGPAYQAFSAALTAVKGQIGNSGNFDTYLTAPGSVHLYDGMNLAALAMIEANSVTPAVYRPYIEKIGDGVPGATVVASFAEGAAALKAGKAIRYVGPGGPTSFDAYHDSTGLFEIDAYDAAGAVKVAGPITPAQIRALGG